MISHEHRAAFVHVPKTGGTSIELVLTGYDWITRDAGDYAVFLRERSSYGPNNGGTLCARDSSYFTKRLAEKHKTQRALQSELGGAWSKYLRFTFVRNPWERLLSVHAHGLRDGPERMPPRFRDWILQPEPRDHMGQLVFQEWVHDWDELDFVGRFEHFGRDLAALLSRLGVPAPPALPRETHGGGGGYDLSAYDLESRERVAQFCAEEIARFGYAFGEVGATRLQVPEPVVRAL